MAVISMTADTFTRQYVGLTVFNNEKESIDISDWKIDAGYEDLIRNELERGFGIRTVNTPYSVSEFARVHELKGPWNAPAFWGPNWDAIAQATRNHCSKNSLDALLVMAKSKGDGTARSTHLAPEGAGLWGRGAFVDLAMLHLIARVALLDCTTGKPMAIRMLASRQFGSLSEISDSGPMLPVNFEDSQVPTEKWSPEKKLQYKNQLSTLPELAIKETLKSLLPVRASNSLK